MLTGDTRAAADAIARAAGIDEVWAGLLPDQKLAQIRDLQAEGRSVAMAATASTTPPPLPGRRRPRHGHRRRSAREAGDAILLRGDPAQNLDALRLARQTLRVMRQNLGWAFGYNLLGIPIAAGVLYPALLDILLNPASPAPPWLSAPSACSPTVCA